MLLKDFESQDQSELLAVDKLNLVLFPHSLPFNPILLKNYNLACKYILIKNALAFMRSKGQIGGNDGTFGVLHRSAVAQYGSDILGVVVTNLLQTNETLVDLLTLLFPTCYFDGLCLARNS